MRIHPLLLSLSLLTSCTGVPANSTKASTGILPGLAYPRLEGAQRMTTPIAVSQLLLSLPAEAVLASPERRRRYLQGDVWVEQVPGTAGNGNYLVVDKNGSDYGFWVRSFQGSRPDVTGYLLEVRGECAELRAAKPTHGVSVAEVVRQCAEAGALHFDSGLRAYRVIDGQPPEDVTDSIAPDPKVSNRAMLAYYASIGASGVFALDDNLSRLPIFRWVVEFDPENTSASTAPPIFDGGHHAHAGFVVWTGERFERRAKVPRALWPCRVARPVECPPAPGYEDPFVID